MDNIIFHAETSDKTWLIDFHGPIQTWRHVFTTCKLFANDSNVGFNIYCGGKFVRRVGPKE